MTVKLPPTHVQQSLFTVLPDKPISKPGEARTRYGAVVNEIVNGLLGLIDIPNSGSHDCVFDAFHKLSDHYVEVKSLRQKNKLPVYDWRLEKDAKAGVPLVYVIGVHRCAGQPDLGRVWHCMAETLDTIYVLPAAEVKRLAAVEPLQRLVAEKPGSRVGYERAGYCEGYRNIPHAAIVGASDQWLPVYREAVVQGLRCRAKVHFHPSIEPW